MPASRAGDAQFQEATGQQMIEEIIFSVNAIF
jgi:hypothetical protein